MFGEMSRLDCPVYQRLNRGREIVEFDIDDADIADGGSGVDSESTGTGESHSG